MRMMTLKVFTHSCRAGPLDGSIPLRFTFSLFTPRCFGVERGPAVVWEPRSHNPAAGHQSATSPVRTPSPGAPTGSLWAEVEHRPPAAGFGWKRQQGTQAETCPFCSYTSVPDHRLVSVFLFSTFRPAVCSYWCGTIRAFCRCSSTRSTWLR